MSQLFKCTLLTSIFVGRLGQVMSEFCRSHGHSCSYPDHCCGDKCCTPTDYEHQYTHLRFNIWNMWYFWFAILFTLMTCLGACGYWRKRRLFFAQERFVQQGLECQVRTNQLTVEPSRSPLLHQIVRLYPTRQGFQVQLSERSVNRTAGEAVQGTFPSPPPYSEVISKPAEFAEISDKDGLPPYPGLPMNLDSSNNYASAVINDTNQTSSIPTVQMSGLPPYTEISHSDSSNTQQQNESEIRENR